MSTLPILPLSAGVEWGCRKSPRFNTVSQYPVSGSRPVSFSASPLPSWEWELSWSVLRDQGLDIDSGDNNAQALKPDFFALTDFFLAMNGSNGRFIYDPAANVVPLEDTQVVYRTSGTLVNGYSGTTNGTQAAFQLYRTSNVTGTPLPVEAIDVLSSISAPAPSGSNPFGLYLNGALVAPSLYTLSQLPLMVTFTTPPTAGQALSWKGNYGYLVKFQEDKLDFTQFMQNLWDLQSLKLEQVCLGF